MIYAGYRWRPANGGPWREHPRVPSQYWFPQMDTSADVGGEENVLRATRKGCGPQCQCMNCRSPMSLHDLPFTMNGLRGLNGTATTADWIWAILGLGVVAGSVVVLTNAILPVRR